MHIRRAERKDLPALAELADAAHIAPMGDLLPPDATMPPHPRPTPASLKRRLLSGNLIVCCDGEIVRGYADFDLVDDHLHIGVLANHAEHRGVTAALVAALRSIHPHLPISRDIVLGHLEQEELHEAVGFVPGETVAAPLGGHSVVARRWWLSPSFEPAVSA